MNGASLRRRYWSSLTGSVTDLSRDRRRYLLGVRSSIVSDLNPRPSFGRRYLASLFGIPLEPLDTAGPASQGKRSCSYATVPDVTGGRDVAVMRSLVGAFITAFEGVIGGVSLCDPVERIKLRAKIACMPKLFDLNDDIGKARSRLAQFSVEFEKDFLVSDQLGVAAKFEAARAGSRAIASVFNSICNLIGSFSDGDSGEAVSLLVRATGIAIDAGCDLSDYIESTVAGRAADFVDVLDEAVYLDFAQDVLHEYLNYFQGADLRDIAVTDELVGVVWDNATEWPKDWRQAIVDHSDELAPKRGIYVVRRSLAGTDEDGSELRNDHRLT